MYNNVVLGKILLRSSAYWKSIITHVDFLRTPLLWEVEKQKITGIFMVIFHELFKIKHDNTTEGRVTSMWII